MANVIITVETSVKSIVILVAEYPRQQKPKVCRQYICCWSPLQKH